MRKIGLLLGLLPLSFAACQSKPELRNGETVASKLPVLSLEAEERSVQPEGGEPKALSLPSVSQFQLSNGLEVYKVHSDLPIFQMTLEFDMGKVSDPEGKIGLSSVCMDLFTEGTKSMDKRAWAEALADHGVEIYSPVGMESATLVMNSLSSELDAGLRLLSSLLMAPGLREEDLERILSQRKAMLLESKATPGALAARLLPALVFGLDHPYGRLQHESDLDAIKKADCERVVSSLAPEGGRAWVLSDLPDAELSARLEKALGFWSGKMPETPSPSAAKPAEGKIFAVNLPGAVQSMVVLSAAGPARDAKDYEANTLMMRALAGSFASRINMNLREDKGYAYGASGAFQYLRAGGYLSIMSSVEVSTTVLALEEMAKEIELFHREGIQDEELHREKNGALEGLMGRFSKPSKTLDEFRKLFFYGLPFTWFEAYPKRLSAIDKKAVDESAAKHLPKTNYNVLVIGDLQHAVKDQPETSVKEALEALSKSRQLGKNGIVYLNADFESLE